MDNTDLLSEKSLDDIKKIAVSMGLFPSDSLSKEDYLNYIKDGTLPHVHYSKEELSLMNMNELRTLAEKFNIKSSYKYKKNELVEIVSEAIENAKEKEDSPKKKTVVELRKEAESRGIKTPYKYKKEELIKLLNELDVLEDSEDNVEALDEDEIEFKDEICEDDFKDPEIKNVEPTFKEDTQVGKEEVKGVLEVLPDGFGFLRVKNYLPGEDDIYVAPSQIRKFRLQTGDMVKGIARETEGDNYNALIYIDEVNGLEAFKVGHRPNFESLTPIYPKEKIKLENDPKDFATRMMDLISPIGKGQRGLIVSQPKSGKTTLLKKLAKSIKLNYPEIHLMVILIDERPEEVTDMQRSVDGEVLYSTFDEQPKNHTRVAEMGLERAKRLVEKGEDVVILMDSLTRLARAYNLITPPSGKTLSGGLDPLSLHKPKRFFGAARNLEEGGSLTIIATALIETGSRMDDVIFEEFKGTGNMEVHLDRRLSEKRIFPAIDIYKSGTRKEELLLSPEEMEFAYGIRRAMGGSSTQEITEKILEQLTLYKNNKTFLENVDINGF